MGDVTNKQHYVYQAHLKRWDDKPWCCNIEEKRIFRRSAENLLCKNQMYKIRKMNHDEKLFLDFVLRKAYRLNDDACSEMWGHVNDYLRIFDYENTLDKLKRVSLDLDEIDDSELKEKIERVEHLVHKGIVNNDEVFYGKYESDVNPWIDSIIKGDTDFYFADPCEGEDRVDENRCDENNPKETFLSFLCIQYFKTEKMRNIFLDYTKKLLDILRDYKDFDIDVGKVKAENVIPHLVWIIQAKCSGALKEKNPNLQVLHNESRLPFITSDQPIINMKAEVNRDAPSDFVLYYPLCPNVAIIVNGGCGNKTIINRNDVDTLNKMMLDQSFKYIVSNKKEVLEGMVEMYL